LSGCVELLHEHGHVVLHCLLADRQLRRDFPVRPPLHEKPDDLMLPRAQFQRLRGDPADAGISKTRNHVGGEILGHVNLVGDRSFNGPEQLLKRAGLRSEPLGARFQDLYCVLYARGGRERG
jgi:hypothetical protein